jgi:hypothetical protein
MTPTGSSEVRSKGKCGWCGPVLELAAPLQGEVDTWMFTR